MYQELKNCRICGNTELAHILDLGDQALTGKFPKTKQENVESMPLELVKCVDNMSKDPTKETCGLVQLRHTGDLSEMYGEHYGYRSGLNQSMVTHLHAKVKKILGTVSLKPGDMVIDIGSNDSTSLQAYPKDAVLVGIDPSGNNFKSFYPSHIQLVSDFFNAKAVTSRFGNKKAKVITSISMFYDLPAPMEFMQDIHSVLADDGIWVFEQSYMPTMLEMNSYDTVCHEHLEYYGLKQIKFMADRVGLKILDVEFNKINGGSFSVMAAKKESAYRADEPKIMGILNREYELGLHTLKPYEEFKQRTADHQKKLAAFFAQAKAEGKKVFGYGASTKGNVVLQYCNVTEAQLPYIAEVNTDKFGAFTPGTRIPIISEKEARQMKPDYMLVLPWHFKDNIVGREQEYLNSGGKLVFPLPHIEVVAK